MDKRTLIATIAASALAAAAIVIAVVLLAGHRGTAPTIATCTAEIMQHPHESAPGPGCKGLSYNDQVRATLIAYGNGARG